VDDASVLEKRTRIILLVPSPSTLSPHDELLNAVFTELNEDFGGVTYSNTRPAVFHGFWLDPTTQLPAPDSSILVMIDASIVDGDSGFTELLAYLGTLKRRLQDGLGQKLIWMTIHQVSRLTAADP